MKENLKQAILFLSNKTAPNIINVFNLITESVKDLADVYFIYHQTTPEIPDEIKALNHYAFTNDILHELNFTPLENSLLPGCDHFPLFKFQLDFPEYDYYWHIEDDVRFCGNWNYLFESFQDVNADFITSHVRKKEEDPHWYWWNSLKMKGRQVEMKNAVRSFNAIHRISNRAVKFLHKELSSGWSGHHEVLLPTLLYRNHFMIIDFGGDGNFVPAGNLHSFYTNRSMTFIPILMGNVENRIYHPVKELRRNCIISIVDKNSVHPKWIHNQQSFDLHLIVTDDSFSRFEFHTPYIYRVKEIGLIANKKDKYKDKYNLIKEYLFRHPEYIHAYDYFFFADNDLFITHQSLERLFCRMKEESREVAQPNFLGRAGEENDYIPCLSREKLKRMLDNGEVLTEYIEVIEDIPAMRLEDARKWNVKTIEEIDSKNEIILCCKKLVHELRQIYQPETKSIVLRLIERLETCDLSNVYTIYEESLMLSLLKVSDSAGNKEIADWAVMLFDNHMNHLVLNTNEEITIQLVADIGYMVEFLSQNNYIEVKTDKILGNISRTINYFILTGRDFISETTLVSVKRYYQARMKNTNFSESNVMHHTEKILYNRLIAKHL